VTPDGDIGERLRKLPPGSAVAIRLNPREYADDYFAVLNAAFKEVRAEPNRQAIFVSVTNASALVWSIAQAMDVSAEQLNFVDAISHTMMNYRDPLPNASYVESPRMLETVMLRIEYLLRRKPGVPTMLIVDSVNSLGIHNPRELLSEFFHILTNNMKSREVLTLLLIVSDDPTSPLDQMISFVVDESIDVVLPRA
jgi:hypothetical protein